MPVNDTTLNRGYQKPHASNTLVYDVDRLRSALDAVDGDIAAKANIASPAFTGTPTAPTAAADTSTTQIATTAYVVGQGYLKSSTASSTYAPLASPTFTGTPVAPTAAVGTNTTQLATTAYVNAEIANDAPTKTGGGASGTWGINITGNAETVTNGVYTTSGVMIARGSLSDPADWNSIVTPGIYTILTPAGAGLTGLNNPGGYQYGTLIVAVDNPGDYARVVQTYIRHNDRNETSIRNKFNQSDWKAWQTIATSSTVGTAGQVLTSNGTAGAPYWATPVSVGLALALG